MIHFRTSPQPSARSPITGQQAVTASAAALGPAACREVLVKADQENAIPVMVGSSTVTTTTGFKLYPGDWVIFAVENVNQVYVIAATTGANVSWSAEV